MVTGSNPVEGTSIFVQNRIKKVIAWRILSTLIALVLSYLFLGEITKTIAMVVAFAVTMTIVHYFFEMWWERPNGKR